MAKTQQFNGVTLRVPGVYTSTDVNQVGSLPLIETGVVNIIGEALKGAPGSSDGVTEWDSSTLADLIAYYGSGPIVDAARALVNASNDPRIPNGAQRILVYKTNASTQASDTLMAGVANYATVTSKNYGTDENLINYRFEEDTSEAFSIEFGADWTATPGNDLTLRVNGGTLVTLTAANMDSAANAASEINTKLDAALGTSGVAYATTDADRISINLLATGHDSSRDGMGISLEFVEDAEYADIGVVAGQQGLAIVAGSSATSLTATNATRTITVNRQADDKTESTDDTTGEVAGNVYLEIGCVAATSCTLTITDLVLTTDATGAGAGDLSLNLSDYATLNDLAEYIDSQTGYSCSIPANINGALSPTVLDNVTAVGICASTADIKPGQVKADSYEIKNWFDRNSQLIEVTEIAKVGLPDVNATKVFLSGAVRGATLTSNVNSALVALEAWDLDTILPLFSQDSSDDLAEDSNYTDSSSSYDIESIHVLTKNHCKLMSNTKNRKERDCYLGYRGTFDECKNQGLSLGTEFASLVFQDSQVINTSGELEFMQPHITAALAVGMQSGGEIGQPTTFKYVAANGVRHRKKQGIVPSATELFDHNRLGHKEQAIDKGLFIFDTPSSGGVRIVIQNTTYGRDGNFVFNRKNVIEAVHFLVKDLRNYLETIFIGTKARTGDAESIRNATIARMKVYLDNEVIVGDDTNNGTGFKNLTVTVEGATAYIDVIVTPVQGREWIFPRIVLDDIRQTA